MKTKLHFLKTTFLAFLTLFIYTSCGSDTDGGGAVPVTPTMSMSNVTLEFGDNEINDPSNSKNFTLTWNDLGENVVVSTSNNSFEISLNNDTFTNELTFTETTGSDQIYVRFSPTELGEQTGTLLIESEGLTSITKSMSGTGVPVTHNYLTFNDERLAFGGEYSQYAVQSFNLHDDLSDIETIKMFVKLRCPSEGCDEWDVFAHVQVKDTDSGEWYELGRFITPYWNDNSQLPRGFEFDVTDFKSLLTGNAELRIYTECWNSRGYEVSVDFDYVVGTPDYQHYAVSRVVQYNNNSIDGVIYGEDASAFDLTKSVTIPANAATTHLRTIITGWGHATPNDSDGRPCAEWCYRTHDVLINGSSMFNHYLGPLGCASNPVSNQAPGNWTPDRAGWCPGMAVPTRIDEFSTAMAGATFSFEYDFEDWTNDLNSTASNPHAYYAISNYVVVKSDTEIVKPSIAE